MAKQKSSFDRAGFDPLRGKPLPTDHANLGFEPNPQVTFEQQTPRNTWETTEGKVGPAVTMPGEADGAPSIVDQGGVARHPHFRNDAQLREMHDDIASRARAHEQVNPQSKVGSIDDPEDLIDDGDDEDTEDMGKKRRGVGK